MGMRSVWKGSIQFSLLNIPIKIYNATDSTETLKFNQLHAGDCHGQIGYKKYCKKCNADDLKNDEIIKGYQYEKEKFVVVDQDDFDSVKTKSTRTAQIKGFIKRDELDLLAVDSTYYVAPDGVAAEKFYSVFKSALEGSKQVAIGTVMIREKETPVAILIQNGSMILLRMKYPNEIRSASEVGVKEKAVDDKLVKQAQQLIKKMATTPTAAYGSIEDTYTEGLKEIIEAKIEGREVVHTDTEEEKSDLSIEEALELALSQS